MMKYFNLYLMCWLLFSGIATAQSMDAQIASVLTVKLTALLVVPVLFCSCLVRWHRR